MGAYLILYFVSLVLALIFYSLSKKRKENIYENLSVISMLSMLFFLAFALYTKDPIEEIITTIPAFWQFVLTSLGGVFTIWKVYLNPLKEKVYSLDKEVAIVKMEVGAVKTTIDHVETELKEYFGRLETKIEQLNFRKSK